MLLIVVISSLFLSLVFTKESVENLRSAAAELCGSESKLKINFTRSSKEFSFKPFFIEATFSQNKSIFKSGERFVSLSRKKFHCVTIKSGSQSTRLRNCNISGNIGKSSLERTLDGVIMFKSFMSSRLKSNLEFI